METSDWKPKLSELEVDLEKPSGMSGDLEIRRRFRVEGRGLIGWSGLRNDDQKLVLCGSKPALLWPPVQFFSPSLQFQVTWAISLFNEIES